MASGDNVRLVDGSTCFEGGIDSGRIPTIQNQQNPTGLKRNQLAWMTNCTCRGGGVLQRTGWLKRVENFANDNGLFQGAEFYKPDADVPYLMAQIAGRIYRFNVWTDNSIVDITGAAGNENPPTTEMAYFCQGEQFMVIQAGDFTTLPLFWDGTTMRRSNGLQPITPSQPGATYTITPNAIWAVPVLGGTVTITLLAPFPGTVNQIGTYGYNGVIGTFQVTAIGVPGVNDVTLQTIASNYIGQNIGPGTVPFTVPPVEANSTNLVASEMPPGKCMVYFMGRLWVQTSPRTYGAGDIAYGPNGTAAYDYRDSILKWQENAYLAGGGSFNVPSQSGEIRCMTYTAAIDTTLGQKQLIIGTRDTIYGVTVPVDRAEWTSVNSNLQPEQRVIQTSYGTLSQRATVRVNGDLYYQAFDGVRSLEMAIRYFQQPGQTSISRNENRVLQFNDRSLLRFASGIEFDNRLLQTVLPFQTPVGVAHKGLIPLDFDLLTSIQEKIQPAWEGLYQGLDFIQCLETSDGGLQRAFAFIHSQDTSRIQIWELTNFSKFEEGDKRVPWYIETPAFVWNDQFRLKELDSMELWLDKIYGTVDIMVDYRADQNPCWTNWQQFQVCSARNSCETVDNPVCYPLTNFRECYKALVMPKPPINCESCNGRPSNIGYQFQLRISFKGWCRIRGILVYALPREKQPYTGIIC